MKPKQILLLFSLALSLIFSACKKNNGDKHHIPQPDPIRPDLSVKINSTVAGFVTDETNEPIALAQVNAGDQQTTTDEYGYFKFSNVSLSQTAGLVKVISSGHFNGYSTFLVQENKETFLRIKLLDKKEIAAVDAVSGGTVTLENGAGISLPANAVVVAGNGSAYTGSVHVSAHWIDPADNSGFQMGMPGDARGTDSLGYLAALKSFSTMAVELTGDGGQVLQIAGGKQATLHLPIPPALAAAAPASISLWSFNDSTGFWKQEGTAIKTGDAYTGSVSHFSFWDGAEGSAFVQFTARITNAASQPLANVPVSVTMAGMPQNAGYGRFGYTNGDGYVTGVIFANANLVLDVLTPCSNAAYSYPFSTLSEDIDLGGLTGNLGQNEVTISGTVSNCSNQPVTDGYVQTYDHGFYNRIHVNNGAFSFTGLTCTNTVAEVVAVDNTTHQQSAVQSVTFVPGLNALGSLTACGTSTFGSIVYTVDGVTATLTEPTDTMAAFQLSPAATNWTQVITLSGHPNTNQQMSFQFDGGTGLSSDHHLSEVYSAAFPSGRGYWPVPVVVNITEYGKIGGFISGNFSCTMLDFNDNGSHPITCTFRVRRKN